MTAVNWLIEQIKNDQNQKALTVLEWMKVIEHAKEIEENQIINAFIEGTKLFDVNDELSARFNASMYFIETYGCNGSDENFKQFSLYEHKETITSADTSTSSQTEISDEEINKEAKRLYDDSDKEYYAFFMGAMFYREQLKSR